MNRFDRITALLIHLQSRRVVKAQDLADRFGVSLRTIYRDVRSLEEAGVPIMGEAGVGYAIMDGYRLPPVMFSKEEALALLTAEKLASRYTDSGVGEHLLSAMTKIRAVLKNTERGILESVDPLIAVESKSERKAFQVGNTLELLLKSISERRQVVIMYQSAKADEPIERVIEPVGVFHDYGFWHTIAYCHLRQDYRHFRSDRISSISVADRPFAVHHRPLDEHLKQNTYGGHKVEVKVLFSLKEAKRFADHKHRFGYVSERPVGDQVEMTFETLSSESFAHWMLMFADCAEVLSPPEVRDYVVELANRTIRSYCNAAEKVEGG